MINNVTELRKHSRHKWVKELDALDADPLIILATNNEGEMFIVKRMDSIMEAIGYLEVAKVYLAVGEDV